MSVKLLLKLNRLFRTPEHPFNTQSAGGQSYAEWEFSRGERSLEVFAPEFTPQEILCLSEKGSQMIGSTAGPKVLDLCCGAGGKSVYYACLGANVTAVDKLEKYRSEAEKLTALKKVPLADLEAQDHASGQTTNTPDLASQDQASGQSACTPNQKIQNQKPWQTECTPSPETRKAASFRFVCADAADTGLPQGSFSTIIMSDAMEHVADPEAVLSECARLLSPGGRLYISFPPYGHPYGAHVSDLIGIPWVQLFFSDAVIGAAYEQLTEGLPDGKERLSFRFSKASGGSWSNTYINKMTLRRFAKLRSKYCLQGLGKNAAPAPITGRPDTQAPNHPAAPFRTLLYREVPLRPWLAPLAKLPGTKEYFVRLAVCVLEKQ